MSGTFVPFCSLFVVVNLLLELLLLPNKGGEKLKGEVTQKNADKGKDFLF
jgi:hypothetical protein